MLNSAAVFQLRACGGSLIATSQVSSVMEPVHGPLLKYGRTSGSGSSGEDWQLGREVSELSRYSKFARIFSIKFIWERVFRFLKRKMLPRTFSANKFCANRAIRFVSQAKNRH